MDRRRGAPGKRGPSLPTCLPALAALNGSVYLHRPASCGCRWRSCTPARERPCGPRPGSALAAALLYGSHVWPAILIGRSLVNVTTMGSVPSSLGNRHRQHPRGAPGRLAGATLGLRPRGLPSERAPSSRSGAPSGLASTAVSATVGVIKPALAGTRGGGASGEIWLTGGSANGGARSS